MVEKRRKAGIKQNHKTQQRLTCEHLLCACRHLKAFHGIAQWILNSCMKWAVLPSPFYRYRNLVTDKLGNWYNYIAGKQGSQDVNPGSPEGQSGFSILKRLNNKMCQYLEDMHNSVNQYFPNDQSLMLQNHACIKNPFQAQGRPMNLHITREWKVHWYSFRFYTTTSL